MPNISSIVAAVVTTVAAVAGGVAITNLQGGLNDITASVPGVADAHLQIAETMPLCPEGTEVASITLQNTVEGLPAARAIVDHGGGSACICVDCSGSDLGTPDAQVPPPAGSGATVNTGGSGGGGLGGIGDGGNSGGGGIPAPGQGGTDAPALPSLPSVPGLPVLPVLPEVPGLPSVPALPAVPAIPPVPSVPGLSDVPSLPSLPDILGNDGCDLCIHADGDTNSGEPQGIASVTSGPDTTSVGVDREADTTIEAPKSDELKARGGTVGRRDGSVDVRVDDDDIDVDADVDADDDDEDDVDVDEDVDDALDDLID